jgi:hypothetical protein
MNLKRRVRTAAAGLLLGSALVFVPAVSGLSPASAGTTESVTASCDVGITSGTYEREINTALEFEVKCRLPGSRSGDEVSWIDWATRGLAGYPEIDPVVAQHNWGCGSAYEGDVDSSGTTATCYLGSVVDEEHSWDLTPVEDGTTDRYSSCSIVYTSGPSTGGETGVSHCLATYHLGPAVMPGTVANRVEAEDIPSRPTEWGLVSDGNYSADAQINTTYTVPLTWSVMIPDGNVGWAVLYGNCDSENRTFEFTVDGDPTVDRSWNCGSQVQSRLQAWTLLLGPGSHTLSVTETYNRVTLDFYELVSGLADPNPPDAVYCDITNVVGDTSAIEKDPAQTYDYRIYFGPRSGIAEDPAADIIRFSASWQENNPDARISSADVTVDAPAIEAGLTYQTDMYVPPAVSPITIHVHFPERRPYVTAFNCISDDGHFGTAFVGGDYLPDPDASHVNDDAATQALQDCVPGGWAILNPLSYATTTGCVFRWAFVPPSGLVPEKWAALQASADGTAIEAVGGVVTTVYSLPGTFVSAANTGDCHGPEVDLTVLTPTAGTMHPLEACTGGGKKMADITNLVLRLGVLLAGAVALVNMILPVFGMKKLAVGGGGGDGQLSFGDGTPVPKDWK